MKLPSLKFNVRRVVLALLIVSLLVVLEIGRRRRSVFLEKANDYAISESSYLTAAKVMERNPPAKKPDLSKIDTSKQGPITAFLEEDPEKLAEEKKVALAVLLDKAAVQGRLKEKYQKAARFPWISVERDPAEPPIPQGPPEPAYGTSPMPTRGAPKEDPAKGEPEPAKKD